MPKLPKLRVRSQITSSILQYTAIANSWNHQKSVEVNYGRVLRLTTHTQMRMFQRDIDIDNAKRAIAEPDQKKTDSYSCVRVVKKIGDKIIVVVY